jgi:hypothetical protein
MWTKFVEELDPAIAVAERDEILAQKPDAPRRAVGLGDLARQQRRDPIATHRLAIAVAGPVRVSSSFSSRDSMVFLISRRRKSRMPPMGIGQPRA